MGDGGKASLRSILHAYAMLDPEVGYVQGMNFVAAQALICAGMNEGWGFALLCAIMGLREEDIAPAGEEAVEGSVDGWAVVRHPGVKRPGLREVYLDTGCGLAVTSYMVHSLLAKALPRLHAHLQSTQVHPVHYFEMLLTLFSLHLPNRTLFKAWTEYFRDGETAMLRLLVVVLADLEPYIMGEAGPEVQEVVEEDGAAASSDDEAAAAASSAAPRARPASSWKTVERTKPGDFSRTVYLLKAFSNFVQDEAADLALVLREAKEAAATGGEYAGAATVRRSGAPTPPRSDDRAAAGGHSVANRPCGQLFMLSGGRASLQPRDDLVARSLLVPVTRAEVEGMRRRAVRAVERGEADAEVPPQDDVLEVLSDLFFSGAALGGAALSEVQRQGHEALAGIHLLVSAPPAAAE